MVAGIFVGVGVGVGVDVGVGMGDNSLKGATKMSYEKTDVYQCSIKFMSIAIEVTASLPRGHGGLSDQFRRASISIPLNIAEGAGKRTKPDCSKFFVIARGSAMECGAIIDVCQLMGFVDSEKARTAKNLLHRIVAMLTKLSGTS